MTSLETGPGSVLEWTPYSDRRAGLTLKHPPDWEPRRGMAGLLVAIVAPDGGTGFPPNINLVRHVNDVQINLDDLARTAVREVSRILTDVAIIDLDQAVVAGSPARRLLFTYRQGIYGLTGEQWVWLTRDNIWTVTAGALTEEYDSVADTFARIVAELNVGIREP